MKIKVNICRVISLEKKMRIYLYETARQGHEKLFEKGKWLCLELFWNRVFFCM